MKERPIIFSGESVRAILDGRKTVTRRKVKTGSVEFCGGSGDDPKDPDNWYSGFENEHEERLTLAEIRCPFGVPGDRLWVRETWNYRGSRWRVGDAHETFFVKYEADGAEREFDLPHGDREGVPKQKCRCKPTGPGRDQIDFEIDHSEELSRFWARKWPAIYLPRRFSRLTLEVVSVRVERLQEITEEDAKAEGVTPFPLDPEGDCWTDGKHLTAFQHLWGEINGWDGEPKARFPWAANPFVWRIEFRRLP